MKKTKANEIEKMFGYNSIIMKSLRYREKERRKISKEIMKLIEKISKTKKGK